MFPEEAPKKCPDGTYVLLSKPVENADDSIISWAGEYDYAGMIIKGIGHRDTDQVSYIVTSEDLRMGFLSSPLTALNEFELELFGDLDVLVIPADDEKIAQKIVEEIDPPVIIPLNTKDGATYKEVILACGGNGSDSMKEVKLTKSGLPKDSREIYVLEK